MSIFVKFDSHDLADALRYRPSLVMRGIAIGRFGLVWSWDKRSGRHSA